MPELFPIKADAIWVEVSVPVRLTENGLVWRESLALRMCQRCGSLVVNQSQHIAWHGAVDSNTTTELPGGGSDA